jgi:cell division protein FtsW (lipid II flippase)
MSYGGSSIMSLFVGMGLVQSVNKRPEKALNFKINNE